jgi:hypothetical protein
MTAGTVGKGADGAAGMQAPVRLSVLFRFSIDTISPPLESSRRADY